MVTPVTRDPVTLDRPGRLTRGWRALTGDLTRTGIVLFAALVFVYAFSHTVTQAGAHQQTGWKAYGIGLSIEVLAFLAWSEIRRRHQFGGSAGWPIAVVIITIVFMLTVQLSATRGLDAKLTTAVPWYPLVWDIAFTMWPAVGLVLAWGLLKTRPTPPLPVEPVVVKEPEKKPEKDPETDGGGGSDDEVTDDVLKPVRDRHAWIAAKVAGGWAVPYAVKLDTIQREFGVSQATAKRDLRKVTEKSA